MIHNNIYYSDQPVLSEQFCNQIIEKFEEDNRKLRGSTGEDHAINETLKKSTDIHISSYPGYESEHRVLKDALLKELKNYQNKLEELTPVYYIPLVNMRLPGFNMQRTLPGDYYHWHSDEEITKDGWARGITYIFYLNTITNKGYTEFNDGSIIKPKQGHCLLFPATWSYVHRGVSPVNETKYIATGWSYYRHLVAVSDKQGIIHPRISHDLT